MQGNEPNYWIPTVGGFSPDGNFTPGAEAYVQYFDSVARTLTGCGTTCTSNPILMGPHWANQGYTQDCLCEFCFGQPYMEQMASTGACYLRELTVRAARV